jgi:hypothetical protein
MAYGGGAAAAAHAAMVQAIKASGAIVRVDTESFLTIVGKSEIPLVVTAFGGIFKKEYKYITSYKGLIFFTKCPVNLMLPSSVELITAKEIWIPN